MITIHTSTNQQPIISLQEQIVQLIPSNCTIIVGCSGGPDSVFLTHILSQIANSKKLNLILAHLNHNLRGEESQKDANFVVELGKKLNLITEVKSVKFKKFSEDQGRQARLKFLEETRKKHKAQWIVLAHHADDNCETIIMNFVRGSGLTGLQGMAFKNGKSLKPLLNLSKNTILEYLKKNKIVYRHDASNEDNSYTRNFYRNNIIPQLKEKNPNLNASLQKTAQTFAEIADFMQNKAINWLKNNHKQGLYNLLTFRKQHPALQKEILRQLHLQTTGHLQELESKHVDEVLDFLLNSHSGKRKNLGKYTEVAIKGKEFKIGKI